MLSLVDSGPVRGVCLLLVITALTVTERSEANSELAPEHFVDYADFRHLAISPDGEQILATTRRADPEADRMVRQHWLLDADGEASAVNLDLPRGSRSLAWHPDGKRIAWLAPTDTGPQVHLRQPRGDEPRLLTEARGGVADFEFGPEGRWLAFTVAQMRPADASAVPDKDSDGVVVDVEQFGVVHLLAGRLGKPTEIRRRVRLNVLDRESGERTTIAGERSVKDFAFSPQGDRLAMTAVSGAHHAGAPTKGEALLVHDLEAGSTEVLAKGSNGRDGSMHHGRVSHSAPTWSPSGERIAFLRTDHEEGMAAVSEVGVHELASGKTRMLTDDQTTEPAVSGMHWQQPQRILLERTSQARRGLYALSLDDGELDPVRVRHGDDDRFSFSIRSPRAAWVAQSTTRPPEVHVGDPAEDASRAVTRFNADLANLPLGSLEAVSWSSSDQQEVHGWLMTPDEASVQSPAPLIIALAGGPGFVLTNRYDLFPRGAWPYPLQVLADRGYAVLVVHYRGTSSFGPQFRQFTPGKEGVADVNSGVRAVSQRPQIDGERLGILGHSHGAWLGPMAAGLGHEFQAAAFAEGIGNFLGAYLGLDGRRNLDLHEPDLGVTPWQDVARYLELSPVFMTQLVENTATLIEAGERAAAVEALQFAKAFWRHDTPHELVIYPDTGHSIRKPATMLESMNRTLAWFETHLPSDA